MFFVLKHKLTDQALGDFLTIMNMHLPNVVPQTKYLFYKKFNHQTFVHHYFCEECFFYFGPSSSCNKDKVCLCHQPKDLESAKCRKSYFSYWSLQSQLELILQDDSTAESLLNQSLKTHGHNSFITNNSLINPSLEQEIQWIYIINEVKHHSYKRKKIY